MKPTGAQSSLHPAIHRLAGWALVWLLLAGCTPPPKPPPPKVVNTSSELAAVAAPPVTRDPALRQVDKGPEDALLLMQVAAYRERLPEEFRKRNNFAWAQAHIAGLEKTEYFAHSSIQDFLDFSTEAAEAMIGISLKPPEPARFTTLCVNQAGAVDGADCWSRSVDTEFKILEDIASRLPDPSAKGHIRLFTELYPCPSCWNVMKQFLAIYTNVEMEVLYRTP
ncbi:MAG: deaminase domain-containing protein [Kiritimatiellia bacterium]|nr:deaminase domain-containing protein [Kiritimatiellia bacterium]